MRPGAAIRDERTPEHTRSIPSLLSLASAWAFRSIRCQTTPTALLLAAADPERSQGVILFTTTARFRADIDHPDGLTNDLLGDASAVLQQAVGTG
jgi:hypothetical protein